MFDQALEEAGFNLIGHQKPQTLAYFEEATSEEERIAVETRSVLEHMQHRRGACGQLKRSQQKQLHDHITAKVIERQKRFAEVECLTDLAEQLS